MKRILLAAMASIALLISSCGKSDDSSGDITGIWQLESETVNGQSQTINDCEKKTVVVFTQNQMTSHDFIENAGACRYSKHVEAYKIEGNVIKSDEDSSISFPFSVSGNTLTIEFVENAKKFVFKYKKITQAELDAILATAIITMEEETTMLKIWKVFGKKSLKQSMDNLRQLMNVEKRLLSLTKIKQLHILFQKTLVFVSILNI